MLGDRRRGFVFCLVVLGFGYAFLRNLDSLCWANEKQVAMIAEVDRLVFNYFERVMALCQAPIKRDLLLFNLETIRTELQQAIRKQANTPGRKAKS